VSDTLTAEIGVGDIYEGLKVVELASDIGGEQLGRLMAMQGAEVIKVEPPEGSPTRSVGPWANGKVSPDTSLTFWFYNVGKRSVVIDLHLGERDKLESLLETADVLITGYQPAQLAELGIDLKQLGTRFPRLVISSVTPFGLTGPRADWHSSDLIGLAVGGVLMSCGYDDHSIPPIRPGGNQAYHMAAAHAHLGVLLALIDRQRTGAGQVIDTSMHDSVAVGGELSNPFWFYPRVNVQRQTGRHAQPEPTQPALFECADGNWIYLALMLSDLRAWRALVSWIQDSPLGSDLIGPEFDDFTYRQTHFTEVQSLLEVFFLLQTAREAYEVGQRRGLATGLLNAPEDVLHDQHLIERGFFVEVEVDGVTVPVPKSPIRTTLTQSSVPGPPPRLPLNRRPMLR